MNGYVRAGVSRLLAYFFVLTVLSFAAHGVVTAAGQEGPSEAVGGFNSALLDAMKRADEIGFSGRYRLLDPVIRETYALPFMAKESAGRYWAYFSEDQRDKYLETYTDWTVSTYAGRFDGYSGERFELGRESQPSKAGTVMVVSRLVKPDNEKVEFHYLLRKMAGKWQVVDIRIKGVSQLALTRSQFASVLKDKGYDGLISMLREKIKAFSEGKAK